MNAKNLSFFPIVMSFFLASSINACGKVGQTVGENVGEGIAHGLVSGIISPLKNVSLLVFLGIIVILFLILAIQVVKRSRGGKKH